MKNFKLLFTISLCAILSLGLIGCKKSKNDSGSSTDEVTITLSGTTYAGVIGTTTLTKNTDGSAVNVYGVYQFTSDSEVTYSEHTSSYSGAQKGESVSGTYTLTYPTLKITCGSKNVSATFSSQTSFNADGITYTKQ